MSSYAQLSDANGNPYVPQGVTQQPIMYSDIPLQQQQQPPVVTVVADQPVAAFSGAPQANSSSGMPSAANMSYMAPVATSLQWIEPTALPDWRKEPIYALIGTGIGIFIPILTGLGHLLIGQTAKFLVVLLLNLLALVAMFILMYIPVVNWIASLAYIVIFRIALQVYLMLDVHELARRLKQGLPIAQGEFSVALPRFHNDLVARCLEKLVRNPVFKTMSPEAPAEYRQRMGYI